MRNGECGMGNEVRVRVVMLATTWIGAGIVVFGATATHAQEPGATIASGFAE